MNRRNDQPAPDSSTQGAEREKQQPYRAFMKWVAFVLVGATVFFLFLYFDLRGTFTAYFSDVIQPWIDRHPVTGPVVYVLVYIVSVILFIPGTAVSLPGGMLFGWLYGTILVSIGSTIGAALAFLIARYAGKEWVEQKAGERVDRIQEGIERHGTRFLAFTRLVPLFPFNLLNYMFGLTRVSFWKYVFISWLAMLPGTFGYVYLGHATKVAAASGKSMKNTMITISIAAGIMVLLSFLPTYLKTEAANEMDVDELSGEADPDR